MSNKLYAGIDDVFKYADPSECADYEGLSAGDVILEGESRLIDYIELVRSDWILESVEEAIYERTGIEDVDLGLMQSQYEDLEEVIGKWLNENAKRFHEIINIREYKLTEKDIEND